MEIARLNLENAKLHKDLVDKLAADNKRIEDKQKIQEEIIKLRNEIDVGYNKKKCDMVKNMENMKKDQNEEMELMLIDLEDAEKKLDNRYDIDKLTKPNWYSNEGWEEEEEAELMSIKCIDDSLLNNPPKFIKRKVNVCVMPKPFAQGAERLAYYMKIGSEQWVLKEFKKRRESINDQSVIIAVHITALASYFTQQFLKHYKETKKKIEFASAHYIYFPNRKRFCYYNAETLLSGQFTRFTNNFGYVSEENCLTPQALGHFSWQFSKKQHMIADLQGICEPERYILTDPAVHSRERLFGATDLGEDGFSAFFKSHKCSNICQRLKLEFHPDQLVLYYGGYETHVRVK